MRAAANLHWPWLIMAISGSALVGVSRKLAAWAWSDCGKPYGFWTERGFRWTYRFLGMAIFLLALAVFAGAIRTSITGALFLCLGVEIALVSQRLGEAHWKRSRSAGRSTYQWSWLVVGVGWAVFGLILLAGHAAESRLAR